MGALRINDLTIRYPTRPAPALDGVTLEVHPGRIVGLTGRTGAGKSTLCLCAAGLVPRVVRASVTGSVLVDEIEATTAKASDLAGAVGIVFSAPALQLSASKPNVREELAFGLENLAVPRAEMDGLIDSVMHRLSISHLADRDPLTLSGGEQQRVAIASIIVMGTGVVVLDEPAAQLDPQGTAEIAGLLREIAADGRAVAIAEHAAAILGATDQCAVMADGRVIALDAPGAALGSAAAPEAGVEPPTLVLLARACGLTTEQAFDEEAIAKGLARTSRESLISTAPPSAAASEPVIAPESVRGLSPVGIELRGLVHQYPGGVEAVRGVDISIGPGETVAIVGQNGSGKTTLVKHLNGLLRPSQGTVWIDGRDTAGQLISDLAGLVGFVFQNPDDQLFNSRVDREVGFGPRNLRLATGQVDRLVANALAMTGLDAERSTNPYDLDLSVRKLVALAGVLAMEPPLLVLDEPTMGQDSPGRRRVGGIVDTWAAGGRTVIAITHDMEFAARHFGRIVVMRQGEIILDGPPDLVFAARNSALLDSTGLTPPPAARVAARLGLPDVPIDANALLRMLAR